jgi:hypothetical protein
MIIVRCETDRRLDVVVGGRRVHRNELGTKRIGEHHYRQATSLTIERRYPEIQVWVDEEARLLARHLVTENPHSNVVSEMHWDSGLLRAIGPNLPDESELVALAWVEPPPRASGDTRSGRLYYSHIIDPSQPPTADNVCWLSHAFPCRLLKSSDEEMKRFEFFKSERVVYTIEGEDEHHDSPDNESKQQHEDAPPPDSELEQWHRLRTPPMGILAGRRLVVRRKNVFISTLGSIRFRRQIFTSLRDPCGGQRLPFPWGSCSFLEALSAARREQPAQVVACEGIYSIATQAAEEAAADGWEFGSIEGIKRIYHACSFDTSYQTLMSHMANASGAVRTHMLSSTLTFMLTSAPTRRAALRARCSRSTPLRNIAAQMTDDEVRSEDGHLFPRLRISRAIVSRAFEDDAELPPWWLHNPTELRTAEPLEQPVA